MVRFILLRLLRGIATLWLVLTAVFIVLRLSGDPAQIMLGPDAPPEAIAAFRLRHGLDDALPVQYARYLANIVQGDFGDSLRDDRPATELLRMRIGATLELGLAAVAIAVVIGLPLGILAALKHNSIWDRVAMIFAFIGQSTPGFFVGILLILLFSLQLTLLPSSGRGSWQQLLMPAFTLATGLLAALARMTRSSMLEVVRQDYIRTARSKGLTERGVVLGHILRNAALPVVTLFGLSLGGLIGGAAITETVFAWPGVGRMAVAAVSNRDFPVIQLIVIAIAASVVLVNLLVDITYGLLDPRVRIGGARQ